MRIGITGGAGYIGSHIIQDLLKEGHELVILDNMSTGSPQNILPESSSYTFIEGDLGKTRDLARFFEKKLEVIYHFAASKAAGDSMKNPALYARNNISNSLKLIEAMTENDVRYLVFSSSAAVYGAPQYLPLDEKHTLNPENYYGYTKLAIEQNLEWFSRLKGIQYAALRYFNAAGYDMEGRVHGLERNPNNLLPIIMEVAAGIRSELQIFGGDYDTPDGTCIRDYIHMNDLSRAHLLAMKYIMGENKSLAVNLGTENGLSVLEVLEAARRLTGLEIPHRIVERRAGDPAKLVASSGMARELLNWEPQHTAIDAFVESTWKVYQENDALKSQ